jgi:hypothetical protein
MFIIEIMGYMYVTSSIAPVLSAIATIFGAIYCTVYGTK